ncbi:MAG TPA: hypothetical protein VJ692_10870 [Nitrospiraceae bacterium]|nr:hypothetical protein [Nitrospiraceae bacterium]
MENVHLDLSPDEALVLSHWLFNYQQTDGLSFSHPAEYLALMRIAAQLDKILAEPFMADYDDLLQQARTRLADGFEGHVRGLKP